MREPAVNSRPPQLLCSPTGRQGIVIVWVSAPHAVAEGLLNWSPL